MHSYPIVIFTHRSVDNFFGLQTANEAAGGSEQAAPQDPKAAAEEAARAAAEELARQEAAEALRREEDEILAKAFVVRDKRSWLRAPPAQEPKRGKLHWDHLLEEMTVCGAVSIAVFV